MDSKRKAEQRLIDGKHYYIKEEEFSDWIVAYHHTLVFVSTFWKIRKNHNQMICEPYESVYAVGDMVENPGDFLEG